MATREPLKATGISTRRGMSAKTRDRAIKEAQLQQTPNKEGQNVADITGQGSHLGGTGAGTNTGMGQTKNLLQKRNKKPAYMQSLNEQEKSENFKIIDNMNKKISYLKNPRFSVNKGPILFTQVSCLKTITAIYM